MATRDHNKSAPLSETEQRERIATMGQSANIRLAAITFLDYETSASTLRQIAGKQGEDLKIRESAIKKIGKSDLLFLRGLEALDPSAKIKQLVSLRIRELGTDSQAT